ncbi:alpha-mannosidase [Rathayibacter sp. VKM Ac-2856]|uniref:alpha-mannosidase n=1 Tax=unclassified Rathayibacter TaxID=2609250 RepID=UPI001565A34C|nr:MULTISPECIES: glycoside hydrolase family 38 C-terminal domain-containing protein [unclassified Rathayibacter]NQX03522.1 alpha-mannosidase [Rathayibacter sp. VKM Ac-2858]NQX18690.1 alpha-mannosidase [Rathayibacter sp. VKM Ac-2856]
MHHDETKAAARVDRFLAERLPLAVTAERTPLAVAAWTAVGEPVGFETATDPRNAYETIEPGAPWGAAWDTTWFRVTGTVPPEWGDAGDRHRIELSLDLGFDRAKPGFQCEGLARAADGRVLKGLEPRNHHVPLDAAPGEEFLVWVEGSSNPDLTGGNDFAGPGAFAPTPLGDRATAGPAPLYRLGRFSLVLIDTVAERLGLELAVLRGLHDELPLTEPRRHEVLAGLTRALNAVDPDDPAGTVADARAAIAPLLAAPAAHSAHRISATGHAHIDSAWLWPTRETVRKCARTFSNVLDLMDRDPDAVFTCSSAQQFAWMKEHHPAIFARIVERVREGRFVPVGNMWVESDVTMPSGESLVRQLQQGARFFQEEFGAISEVGWLPDSFGYSAALPQLLRKAGLRWFFTQKMCWNETNAMPHHSFVWEGLDGSRIFTHFPPSNTYSGDLRPTELARIVRNFQEHGRATRSLMPFGYGDGGGGPTREMMTLARLQSDLEGSPRLEFSSAHDFFEAAETEYADPPVWSGEMYLEFHRGILTSQARTKRGNRRNERLLAEAEHWASVASLRHGVPFPFDELDALWRRVLLLQFHDILPGTAIAWVHREAERTHAEVTEALERIIVERLAVVVGPGERMLALNAAPVVVDGVPARGGAVLAPVEGLPVRADGEGFVLESSLLTVVVTATGQLSSIVDRASGRELLPAGRVANLLQLHRDEPNQWDAWDLDAAYRDTVVDLVEGTVELGGDGASVVVRRSVGREGSTVVQTIALDPREPAVRIRTVVDWHERRKLLKLAFPLDVHAEHSSAETQFGHVRRPVHTNTSWEAAKYEICAHRWLHVGEPGFGVAVASDSVYGYDVQRAIDGGRVSTVVRQSLLRAPTFPDPEADQGVHEILSTLTVAPGIADAVRAGFAASTAPRVVRGGAAPEPLVAVEDPAVVVDTVVLAADRSGDVIVRLHEALGGRVRTMLVVAHPLAAVREVDLLDRDVEGTALLDAALLGADSGRISLELRPFEVVSLRLSPASVPSSTSIPISEETP